MVNKNEMITDVLDAMTHNKYDMEECEFRPDIHYWEVEGFKENGIEIVDKLDNSTYVVLDGYISNLYYGDTSFHGDAVNVGEALTGVLLYDKENKKLCYLRRSENPFKPSMTNSLFDYVGKSFTITGDEVDEYGYYKTKAIKFNVESLKRRSINVLDSLKSIDIKNITASKNRMIDKIVKNLKIAVQNEFFDNANRVLSNDAFISDDKLNQAKDMLYKDNAEFMQCLKDYLALNKDFKRAIQAQKEMDKGM